jgi:predicted RNA binding protein YcfA (HicA-like mRNA interferase family)
MSRAESMKLVKDLRKQGFTVERTGSGHWKIGAPDQENSVVMAFSPRTGGQHKTLKRLKEIGYRP